MSRRTRRSKKRKKRRSFDESTIGSVRIKRVGKRIFLRNTATPEQFAAMRKALADWKARAPYEMRARSEALLALIVDLDPLVVLGFVFSHHHLAPLLAGKEMAESYAVIEHLALLIAKEPRAGDDMTIDLGTRQQLFDQLSTQLQEAIQFTSPDLLTDGSVLRDEPFRDALAPILSWELAVRNERYDHQQKALLQALFTPFAGDLQTVLGFTCDDAMVIEENYARRIKAVALEGDEMGHRVMSDVDRILQKKPASDERTATLVNEIRAAIPSADVRLHAFWQLLPWTALRTGHSIAPTLDDLVSETGLERDIVENSLRDLTTGAADLGGYWYMLPVSPLKTKPLVAIGNHYALPSPGLFLTALQTLFEDTLKATPSWETYQQHRAGFGEDHAADLFARALPRAIIYKNLKYKSGTGAGEVDVMVLFDRQLFLVEVKSGDFASAARAGVEARVETTIRDLVIKAHEQVGRAADYIAGVPVATFRAGPSKFEIRKADFDDVHLMSLTLEQLGHIVNNAGAFVYAGKARAPWSVSLDDLEIITDVLTRPAEFLHYITRREAYLPHAHIQNGDELGFLEAYLRTSLREDPTTFVGHDQVMMDPSSKTIDSFENAKGAGETVSPPEHKIPIEIAMLLDVLAQTQPAGWISASLTLLDLISRHQRLLARTVRKVVAGLQVRGVTANSEDGATIADLRIDDPRLLADGEGVVLRVDRSLNVLALRFAPPTSAT